MTANKEIAVYLEYLLDHKGACKEENCARCQSLRSICQAVRSLIFSPPHQDRALKQGKRGFK